MINKYLRVIAVVTIISNLLYQVGAIVKPLPGSNQLVVNICYTINSAFQCVLLMMSNSNKIDKNSNYIYALWIDIILR